MNVLSHLLIISTLGNYNFSPLDYVPLMYIINMLVVQQYIFLSIKFFRVYHLPKQKLYFLFFLSFIFIYVVCSNKWKLLHISGYIRFTSFWFLLPPLYLPTLPSQPQTHSPTIPPPHPGTVSGKDPESMRTLWNKTIL